MEPLPKDALAGRTIGVSVSQSPDLKRLGLLETHFRLALAEIARSVLVGGGRLVYGGHLAPEGYTTFLVRELQKYGRRDRPLTVCLAWQEHRRMKLSELEAARKELGLNGSILYLDPDGADVDPAAGRGEQPEMIDDPALLGRALTALRRRMNTLTHARVLIGGKTHDMQGTLPGLMEEALLACEAGVPLFLVGGFGGATLEIVRALQVDDGSWLPRRPDAPPEDPRLTEGRRRLAEIAAGPTWHSLNNGLTGDENLRLAATHRPSDIAALVSIGLGRLVLDAPVVDMPRGKVAKNPPAAGEGMAKSATKAASAKANPKKRAGSRKWRPVE